MRISKDQDYAILFMSILSLKHSELISLQNISYDYGIPYYFLKKIARQLKHAGLVEAKEGATGGYRLAKNAYQITLAEIIEALNGPIALVDCVANSYCPAEEFCLASHVMKKVSNDVRQVFSNVRLADMVSAKSVYH